MKVVVAMSGGVDSSVTAALLKQHGMEVIGVHIRFWEDPARDGSADKTSKNKCCTLNGLEDARVVAQQLNIPFYVMNAQEEFKSNVINYFLDSYATGATPNPCVACNRTIKFGSLLARAAALGAEVVASGHYARVIKKDNGYCLRVARDAAKDQSYFLYHLSQAKLSRVTFPVGEMRKSEVYEVARRHGLKRVVEKPQSQGLCFFSEASPRAFLRRYLPMKKFARGPIKTAGGKIIGEHAGLPLYTVGQRSGLGVGGIKGHPERSPWYIIRIESETNSLIVGGEDEVLCPEFEITALEFVSGAASKQEFETAVRIRHRGELIPGKVRITAGGAKVSLKKPARGVAKGQAAVFYDGDEVIGGGIIQ